MSNEFGDYLPEDDSDLEEEGELIQAKSYPQAKKKCEQVAKEYGGINPKVEKLDQGWFDCQFQVWRNSSDA